MCVIFVEKLNNNLIEKTNLLISFLQKKQDIHFIILYINKEIDILMLEYEYIDVVNKSYFFQAYKNYQHEFQFILWIQTLFFIEKEQDFDIKEFYQNLIGRICFYGMQGEAISNDWAWKEYNFIYPGKRINEGISIKWKNKRMKIIKQEKCEYIYIGNNKDIYLEELEANKTRTIVYTESQNNNGSFSKINVAKNLAEGWINIDAETFKKYCLNFDSGFIQPKLIRKEIIENYKEWIEKNYDIEVYEAFKKEKKRKQIMITVVCFFVVCIILCIIFL